MSSCSDDLQAGGEMGALVRGFDWSKTALGPIEAWPASLRTTVSTLLHSRQPMFLWWGSELIQFYNDAYRPSLGVGKHPRALGQRGRDCWQESWSIIWPQIHDVMSHARSSWNEDALVPIFRNGRIEEVYWTYGYSPVFDDDGKIGGTLVVGTETTERVFADRRARAIVEGERNNLLLQAPIAIAVLTGPEHVFQLANPVYLRMVGCDDLVGKTFREAFPALAGTVLPAILDQVYRTGAPYMTNELRVPLGVRGDRYVTFNLEPMRNTAGKVYGMLAVTVDITEQVRARQTLEKTYAEREVLLAELQAANRTKDDFLAMLSHELRNPLSPIVTALELMKLRDVDHASGIRVVERQVRHLIHLVDDLLDVARITRGQLELVRERVELSAVIARAIEMSSPLIERGGHVLTVEVPARGLLINADVTRLAQVIANLLNNAAKYTPQNGHIGIDAHLVNGQVVVRVRDDGVGIAPEMLGKIFDLFTQVPQDLARSQGGLGLGLSIVKAFTEKHGGSVTARSAGRGHGSEFTVRLPVGPMEAAATSAPAAPAVPGPDGDRHPRRILIVDDNEDAAWILAETLSVIGHDVRCAHDGPSALHAAIEHVPEVALIDIGLPVMDGYELAARMRAEPRVTGVRLIALTGYSQPGDRQRSTDAGFAAHLVKPVSINVLVETIDVVR